MLRAIFGDPPRKVEGPLLEADQAINTYLHSLTAIPPEKQTPHERRFVIWCRSFLRAIDEMEQSHYAAVRFGLKVKKAHVDDMSPEEQTEYHSHLYFYRNALIRVFAILDKLGHFMNERFVLQTERIKSRFSYFTVLRNMHENGLHTDLEQQLYDIKERFKEPVARLRNQRNMEIHTINADLLDDLLKAAELRYGERIYVETEDIKANLKDLQYGCEMTLRAVAAVFHYLQKRQSGPDAAAARG